MGYGAVSVGLGKGGFGLGWRSVEHVAWCAGLLRAVPAERARCHSRRLSFGVWGDGARIAATSRSTSLRGGRVAHYARFDASATSVAGPAAQSKATNASA